MTPEQLEAEQKLYAAAYWDARSAFEAKYGKGRTDAERQAIRDIATEAGLLAVRMASTTRLHPSLV